MASECKVFGQSAPSAAVATDLFTVGASKSCTVNFQACNRGSVTDKARIAIVKSGDTLDTKHYLVYDAEIAAGSMLNLTGFCMGAGDKVSVRSESGYLSFTATGLEVS